MRRDPHEAIPDPVELDQPLGRALEAESRTLGGVLEQVGLVCGERPRRERADVDDAEQPATREQRRAEQRFDPFLPEDRVVDVGPIDVGDDDRADVGGDPPGEPASHRDPHRGFDLLLEAGGGRRDELVPLFVEEEDRARVDAEDFAHPDDELVEQRARREVRQRNVGDAVEPAQPVCDRARSAA